MILIRCIIRINSRHTIILLTHSPRLSDLYRTETMVLIIIMISYHHYPGLNTIILG